MKLFKVTLVLAVIALAAARPQQSLDPSYLQYYSQIGQQQAAPQQKSIDSTPIYEHGSQEAEQQYVPQAQQIRLKDSTAEQARQAAPSAYISPSLRQYQQAQHQPQQHQPQALQYVQQPQPQPAVYKQAPKQTLVVRRPQYQEPQQAAPQRFNKEEIDEEEEYSEPQSYQFGFDVKDDEFTNYQNRKEVKEGNVIKGSYSVVDSDGFIRTVTYTADPKEGFKAQVVREPTDIVIKFPTPAPEHRVQQQSHSQSAGQQSQHGGQQSQYSQAQYRPAQKQQQPQQYQYQ
jgi:hypothetical protein